MWLIIHALTSMKFRETTDVKSKMNNYIPEKTMDVITYPYPNSS